MPIVDAPPNMTAGGLSRDYVAIWADVRRMIPQVAPEWTYVEDDDPGVALLQLTCYLNDHLHHRADTVQRDVAPTRSPHRETVREFAEWLGYLARRRTAAEVGVTFSVAEALEEDLPIPRGTQMRGEGPNGAATFESDDETVLPAGETSVLAHAVEGETSSDVLLGTATGDPFERFRLPDLDVIFNWQDDDLVVTVASETASHARWPATITDADLAYWVRQAPDGYLELRFGDGTHGRSLPPGAQVRCTFRRGGGPIGNVGAGAINEVVSEVQLSDGTPVELSVTNASAAAPGLPEESLDSIRAAAPAFFRTQNRAVTRDDYVNLAQAVPGVYRARARVAGVNGVRISLVPTGLADGQRVSAALKARVVRALDPVKMCTDVVTAEAARLIPIDVELDVRARSTARNGVTRESVRQLFIGDTGIFSEEVNDIAARLRFSDMVAAVEALPRVDFLDVTRYCRRPTLTWSNYDGTAGLSSTGVTLGPLTREQIWRLEMRTATTFRVTGSLSGLLPSFGTVGAVFSDPGGEVSFKLEDPDETLVPGATALLRVGKLVGNISLGEDEFPIFDANSVRVRVRGGIGA